MRGRKKKEKGILKELKRGKRKKFSRVFLSRWLIVMLVVALLYGEGLVIFTTYQKGKYAQNFSLAGTELGEDCFLLMSDCTEQERYNYLSYKLASNVTKYDTFSYVCDAYDKKVLASCEEKLFLIQSKAAGEGFRILTCETNKIDGWDEYRRWLTEGYKPYQAIWELLYCDFIYSNGTEFIPIDLRSEVYVRELRSTTLTPVNDVPSLLLNSERSIPAGYEHEYIGADWIGSMGVTGYSPTSPSGLYNKSHADGYKMLLSLYSSLRHEPKFQIKEESFWGLRYGDISTVALSDGRPVLLIQAMVMDVRKNYGSILLMIGFGLFGLGTLLALLLAKLSYTRLKAGYALEDYRKTLTNTMAHDLKSPLMSISGYAENLQANLNTQKQTYYSEAILNSVQYMNGIIESVLYLSKMEEGKQILRKEALQVREVFDKLVAERKESFEERGLRIETAGEAMLEADATLLKQLFSNLLDNAIKYASKDTAICVMMKDKEISIQNVCEEDLSAVEGTLCDPFVVSDDSRSNRKGSGLGLAIAKNICELHGFGFELICKEKSLEAKIKG